MGIAIAPDAPAQSGKINKCVVDDRVVFQNTACPPPAPPKAPPSNAKIGKLDAEAMRAEQARQREALQKGFAPAAAPTAQRSLPPGPNGTIATNDCFARGDALAQVYFVNIKQAIEVKMLASEMMASGCAQSVGAQGAACVTECKAGFQAEAKRWVKHGWGK
jgi:hypothetical protein